MLAGLSPLGGSVLRSVLASLEQVVFEGLTGLLAEQRNGLDFSSSGLSQVRSSLGGAPTPFPSSDSSARRMLGVTHAAGAWGGQGKGGRGLGKQGRTSGHGHGRAGLPTRLPGERCRKGST